MGNKYTKSARGQLCQMRLEGCLPSSETVVAAHLNGGGVALKRSPIHIFYSCMNCHDLYDGRKQANPPYPREYLDDEARKAVIRTQDIMIKEGVIKL